MTEEYLHYVWKYQLFPIACLSTFEQESITVLKAGVHNFNSGPDFLDARVKIGDAIWAGNVEIHVRSSDWNKHRHQYDVAYNNVVLHVVYENDSLIYNEAGNIIPVLELKELIDHHHYFNYERFVASELWVPCANQIKEVPSIVLSGWKSRLLYNRLETKTEAILDELHRTSGNWAEVFHRFLCRSFGMKVNSEAMMELAQKLPVRLLLKEGSELIKLEALFFGQAGLLNNSLEDEYHQELRKEYLYLKQKYQLQSLRKVQWKYSRLRPPNFPTIRLAQLAMLYSINVNMFELIRDRQSFENIKMVLETGVSGYWQSHYRFGVVAKSRISSQVGQSLIDNVMINVVVPITFAYGKSIADQNYMEYAVELIENIKTEDNKVVRGWEKIGVDVNGAQESQAMLELYQNYCSAKKCLNCNIGVRLLKDAGG